MIDLAKIKAKLAATGQPKEKKEKGFEFWKPEIRAEPYVMRFLPVSDSEGMPFELVGTYNDLLEDQGPGRVNSIVAPCTLGLPDPYVDFFKKIRNDKSYDWKTFSSKLQPQSKRQALFILRGDSTKKIYVWSMSNNDYESLLRKATSSRTKGANVFDPIGGWDFEVTVSALKNDKGVPQMWNNKPRKNYEFDLFEQCRLADTNEEIAEITARTPSMIEYQKQWAKTPEEMEQILENFAARALKTVPNSVSKESEKKTVENLTPPKPSKKPAATETGSEDTETALAEAFGDVQF
jgi:hypothetical protein